MLRRALVALSLACAVVQAAPRQDQERLSPSALTDHGYGFVYRAPAGWELLDEVGAREVLPSMALAVGPHSQFVAVTVSEHPSPGAWVRDTLAGFGLANDGELGRLELDEHLAVWATRPCVFGGVPVRLVLSAVAHRGRVLGLVNWRPASDPPTVAAVRELWKPVNLLAGPELVGRPLPPAPDQTGVGWRTRQGTFESAAFGLVFSPAPGMSLLVGDELAQLHPDATVGWSDPALGITGALIAERAPPGGEAEYAQALDAAFESDVRGEPVAQVEVSLDGAQGALDVYRFSEQQVSYLAYGVLAREGLVLQVQLEWPAASHEQALEAAPGQVACARFLPAEARAALAAELLRAPHPQHALGPDYVLRGGVYRDFTQRVSWQAPAGFWRVYCGDDPEARLELSAPQLGLGASCAVEELPEALSAEQVHTAVRDAVLGDAGAEPDGEPQAVVGQGIEFLVTRFTVQAAFELRCLLATAVVGRRALSVRLWGLPELVAQNERALNACLLGFRPLPEDARAVSLDPGRIENLRLGYGLTLEGEGWSTLIEPTPDWRWHHAVFTRGEARVELRALVQPGSGQSESARAAARVSLRADLAERFELAPTSGEPVDHGPFHGRRLGGAADGPEVALFTVGDRLLAVVISGPQDARPELGQVLEGLRLLP